MKAYKLVEVDCVKYDGSNYDEVREACGNHLVTKKENFRKGMDVAIHGIFSDHPLKEGEYAVWNKAGWVVLTEEEFRKSYRTEI